MSKAQKRLLFLLASMVASIVYIGFLRFGVPFVNSFFGARLETAFMFATVVTGILMFFLAIFLGVFFKGFYYWFITFVFGLAITGACLAITLIGIGHDYGSFHDGYYWCRYYSPIEEDEYGNLYRTYKVNDRFCANEHKIKIYE